MEEYLRELREPMKMKACFVGDYAVGKTSVAERFVHNRFRSAYIPTIGTQILKKQFVLANPRGRGTIQIDMVIWDIMGQKGFRELLNEAYFHGARGILAVCDITRKETLSNLKYWIESVRKVTGPIPTLVLGNKWDLYEEREIDESDILKLAKDYGMASDMTSAKTGKNIEKAFSSLAERHILDHLMGEGNTESEGPELKSTKTSHRVSSSQEAA